MGIDIRIKKIIEEEIDFIKTIKGNGFSQQTENSASQLITSLNQLNDISHYQTCLEAIKNLACSLTKDGKEYETQKTRLWQLNNCLIIESCKPKYLVNSLKN